MTKNGWLCTLNHPAWSLQPTNDVVEINNIKMERLSLNNEIEIINELVRQLVNQNTRVLQSQEEYHQKYNDLVERYNKTKEKLDEALDERTYKLGQSTKLKLFIKELESAELLLNEWNDEVWMLMIEKAIVHKDKSITFHFYNGKEVRVYSNEAILH